MTSTLLVLLLLSQAGGPDNPPDGVMEPPLAASQAGGWRYLTRLEMTTLALLPRAGVGAEEGFAQVEPTVIIDGGAEFGVNVGAPVRLRLWGGGEGAGLVRREDWDSLSDWGQLVRGLEVAVKGLAVGMGQPGARYLGAAEVRWRFLGGRLYAMGTGGTLLFPEGLGALRLGAFVSMGLGVGNAR